MYEELRATSSSAAVREEGKGESMMNVTISGDAEQLVREEMATGRYDSAQEVVQEGLRLLHERSLLNEQIEEGLAELDRGESVPGEDAFQALWEKSRQQHKAP